MSHATLMIAASEHDADMLYISGMFVPDPFVVIGIDGQWHGLFSPLEVDRARSQSRLDEVHLDTPWRERASASGLPEGLAGAAAAFLRERNIDTLTVPPHFPLALAEKLRGAGFSVSPADGAMFPQRAIKREDEIRELAKAERLTRQSMQQAEAFLARCGIMDNGHISHPETGKRVHARDVRAVIETFLIGHGAVPSHTIVACGREAADPHNIGNRFLKAGEPIIIDIFPHLVASGYWGDMTRTYVKGKASSELKRLYATVRNGQDIGLEMVMAGASGAAIHRCIVDHFDRQGYPTGMQRGRQCGFFHGTGHGVGLEIHESPRISVRDDTLQAGQVVTVEPGLYYPHLGGVRIEDMVVVRAHGCDNLTRYKRKFEIP
jgi:Xaa-Pro aminopeptidase